MRAFAVGDRVKVISVPDWLIHDLPENEKQEILACLGKTAVIEDIDKYGYYWVGFGSTREEGEASYYNGHFFCVPRGCLEAT